MRLLIVDDERWILLGLKHIIEQMETAFDRIDMAGHADEALAMMEELRYDLVITDIKMPGISGLEFIEEAKRRALCERFVVLSGYSDFEYAQCAIRNSVVDYLLKPIDKNELARMLKHVGDSQMEQDVQALHETETAIRDALYSNRKNAACELSFGKECELLALYIQQNAPLSITISSMAQSLFPGACVLKIYSAPIYIMLGKVGELKHSALNEQLTDQTNLRAACLSGRIETAGEVRRLYRLAVEACLRGAFVNGADAASAKEKRLSKLAYELALSDAMSAIVDDSRKDVDNAYVCRLLEQVDMEYAQDINLETLSQRIGLNPAYLGRVFRQSMQMSFSQYLGQYRIHKAVEMFRKHPQWTFQEVGLAVGFQEVRNFYRKFKEEVGVTPGEFRNWLNESE